jgi:AraC-like DNA-binding protein
MNFDAVKPACFRYSTSAIPERERLPYWSELCRVADVQMFSDGLFEAEASLVVLPGVKVGRCWSNIPAYWKRNGAAGFADFALLISHHGRILFSQGGRDVEVETGDAVAIVDGEPASIRYRSLDDVVVWVPSNGLRPLVPNLEDRSARLIPHQSEALRTLRGYVTGLSESVDLADPSLSKLVADHICDLVALAIGPTRDGVEIAKGRGLRAARLQAVKASIIENLGSTELTEAAVAQCQHVTPRYIRMLFADEGTTFSDFVLEQRLLRARRMLTSPTHANRSIGAIALDAGFSDLSHFNRSFKRRFGATPSEVRAEGRTRGASGSGFAANPSPSPPWHQVGKS